jgi:para-aminobenzoate synthetase component 1
VFHLPGVTACASRELVPDGDLLDLFERLRPLPFPWLLDSALPSPRLGRYSFAGSDPYLVLRARGTRVELDCRRAARPGLEPAGAVFDADPLDVLRALWPPPPPRAELAPPFVGGAVGYLGYELAGRIEDLVFGGDDDLGLPDLYVLFVDRLVSFDCAEDRFSVHALGFGGDAAAAGERAEQAADELLHRLSAPASSRGESGARAVRSPRAPFAFFDAGTYAKAVDAAKEEIAAGNAYQVCLTHRMERDHAGCSWSLYRRLREENPAPFASYVELPEVAIASSSPERFLRLSPDRSVESRPIKGTRPRAEGDADRASRARLADSAKDRAENLMIVDLVRNDLGRVCETGSVEVPELMTIEAYASVFQMVSTVRGRLRADRDAIDLLRATFPPGSMTGAPKIAAMQIIDRLEPVRRGIYSGALGYFDVRGGVDLCVVIRTVLARGGRAYVHAGGGIVADSDPLGEWRETLDKAGPLLTSLQVPRRGVHEMGSSPRPSAARRRS